MKRLMSAAAMRRNMLEITPATRDRTSLQCAKSRLHTETSAKENGAGADLSIASVSCVNHSPLDVERAGCLPACLPLPTLLAEVAAFILQRPKFGI